MTDAPIYTPGTPSWVDLGSPDVPASVGFYAALFGWEAEDQGPEAGHYHLCRLGGLDVAGIGPKMMEAQPTAWGTYVDVADIDVTVGTVVDAGGSVVSGPMDVMDKGRLAILIDPTGAALGLWQAGSHLGAGLVNQPGSLVWNELSTRDTAGATDFYAQIFGWVADRQPMGEMPYWEWKLNGKAVAGMMETAAETPAEVPPHWLVYFGVADCDKSVASATDLGATLLFGPMDIPPGRFSVLADPQGATFAMIALAQVA